MLLQKRWNRILANLELTRITKPIEINFYRHHIMMIRHHKRIGKLSLI